MNFIANLIQRVRKISILPLTTSSLYKNLLPSFPLALPVAGHLTVSTTSPQLPLLQSSFFQVKRCGHSSVEAVALVAPWDDPKSRDPSSLPKGPSGEFSPFPHKNPWKKKLAFQTLQAIAGGIFFLMRTQGSYIYIYGYLTCLRLGFFSW